MIKSWQLVSTCPKCGAPIYERRDEVSDLPQVYFTCGCRTIVTLSTSEADLHNVFTSNNETY